MKEISPTGRDFQSLTLEKWIYNPRITLMPLYLFLYHYFFYKPFYLSMPLKPAMDIERQTDPLRHTKNSSIRIYI